MLTVTGAVIINIDSSESSCFLAHKWIIWMERMEKIRRIYFIHKFIGIKGERDARVYLNWHFHKQIVFRESSLTFNLQHHTGAEKVEVLARGSHSPGRTAFFSHLATDPCLHMELAPHLLSRTLTCLCSILSASRKAQCHKKTWHSVYVPAVPDSHHSAPPCRQVFHSLSIHKDKFSKVTG